MNEVTTTRLHVITVHCPNCNAPLIYTPELIHIGTHRPLFTCDQKQCARHGESFVLGNADNFGDRVERDQENTKLSNLAAERKDHE